MSSNGAKRSRAWTSCDQVQEKRSRVEDDSALETLLPLLDLTSLSSEADISLRFEQIASTILHGYHLCLAQSAENSVAFELLEIEFYLRKDACHEDPFAHASEEQASSGKWYFHRSPRRSEDASRSMTSTTGYRGGTRKGLDLAFGGPVASSFFGEVASPTSSSIRGGVLFRSMRRLPDATVISGPSLLVDEILRLSDASSISNLVQDKWAGDTSALSPRKSYPHLFLKRRPAKEMSSSRIYTSPRIGLDLSHPGTIASFTHPRVRFVGKPYRYFVHPDLLTANGRTQTFLGILLNLRSSLAASQPEDLDETCKELALLSGLKIATAKKYCEDYEVGRSKGMLAGFVGPGGKGVSGSPSKYLRMMGVLERMTGDSAEQI